MTSMSSLSFQLVVSQEMNHHQENNDDDLKTSLISKSTQDDEEKATCKSQEMQQHLLLTSLKERIRHAILQWNEEYQDAGANLLVRKSFRFLLHVDGSKVECIEVTKKNSSQDEENDDDDEEEGQTLENTSVETDDDDEELSNLEQEETEEEERIEWSQVATTSTNHKISSANTYEEEVATTTKGSSSSIVEVDETLVAVSESKEEILQGEVVQAQPTETSEDATEVSPTVEETKTNDQEEYTVKEETVEEDTVALGEVPVASSVEENSNEESPEECPGQPQATEGTELAVELEEASVMMSEIEWTRGESIVSDVCASGDGSVGDDNDDASIVDEEHSKGEEEEEDDDDDEGANVWSMNRPQFDWAGGRPIKNKKTVDTIQEEDCSCNEDSSDDDDFSESDHPQGKKRRSRRALLVNGEYTSSSDEDEQDDEYEYEQSKNKKKEKKGLRRDGRDNRKSSSSATIIHPKKAIKDAKKKYKDAKNMFTSFFIEGDKKPTSSRKLFDLNGNDVQQQRSQYEDQRMPRYGDNPGNHYPPHPHKGRGPPPGYNRASPGDGRRPPQQGYYGGDPGYGHAYQGRHDRRQQPPGAPMRRPPATNPNQYPPHQRGPPPKGVQPPRPQLQRSATAPRRSIMNAPAEAQGGHPAARRPQSSRSLLPPYDMKNTPSRREPPLRQNVGRAKSFDGPNRDPHQQLPSTQSGKLQSSSRPQLRKAKSASAGRKATMKRRPSRD